MLSRGMKWTFVMNLCSSSSPVKVRRVTAVYVIKLVISILDTVISMRPSPDLEFTSRIEDRLFRPDSILRTTSDGSILVQRLLDLGRFEINLRSNQSPDIAY
ncbi:hypothetical protein AX15_001394 [Amanita polypyramis BW_CC]|nr:hypothetical protein AX15_001394 [Amanita polypyramis BW_CC]